MRVIKLGKTEIDPETFKLWLEEMGKSQYRQNSYALFKHNCNNFSEDAAQFLRKNQTVRLKSFYTEGWV